MNFLISLHVYFILSRTMNKDFEISYLVEKKLTAPSVFNNPISTLVDDFEWLILQLTEIGFSRWDSAYS
jgi:hypothetical protein